MSEAKGQGVLSRVRRRAVTVPLVVMFCVCILVTWPLLVVLGLAVGVFRAKRFALLRTLTLAAAYAVMELWGLLALTVAWVVSGFGLATRALERRAFWVQRIWLRGLWWAARRCFGLKVELEGEVPTKGPVLVLARHTSMLDVLIPGNYVLTSRLQLRWVLKKELLLEPCLDIAGHWMPNYFVDRSGEDSEKELSAIEALAQGMGEGEGAIIFPEGTRFTQKRRARVLERLQGSDPEAATYAASLKHLLPPRLGGSRAMLSGAPAASVLFLAHHGLEGSRSWTQLISGRLVGRTLHVKISSAERPEPEEVRAWLRQHWSRMDAWIDERA